MDEIEKYLEDARLQTKTGLVRVASGFGLVALVFFAFALLMTDIGHAVGCLVGGCACLIAGGFAFHSSRQYQRTVTLEQQLETLAKLGIELNEGVTIDDLLRSWDRETYEKDPFGTIFFALGAELEGEPWGRNICDQVWNFDLECIEGEDSYVTIVKNLCRIAGNEAFLTDLEDRVELDADEAWLAYNVGNTRREHVIPMDDDWADSGTVAAVMRDIEHGGAKFFAKDNGQASVLFYLRPDIALELNRLTGGALTPVHK